MSKYVYININLKVTDNPAATAAAIFRVSAAICVLIKALARLFSRSKFTRHNTEYIDSSAYSEFELYMFRGKYCNQLFYFG